MQKLHEPRQRLYKKYVDVLTVMGKNEVLKPVAVLWDNGIKYEIDRVLQIRNKASSVGGCGLCYECVIQGQKRDLYFERTRWFLESTKPPFKNLSQIFICSCFISSLPYFSLPVKFNTSYLKTA